LDTIDSLHRRRIESLAQACGLRRELGEPDAKFEARVLEAIAKLPPKKISTLPVNPAWKG
jgi:hypothetical protein